MSEAISSWEAGASKAWRGRKMKLDGAKQLDEIERHKYLMSQRRGFDVGWDAACQDWVKHHAAAWRRWWEEQPESGE